MVEKTQFVSWEERYTVGIPLIDKQHRELLRLTNKLYETCQKGNEFIETGFRDAARSVVEYIKVHFIIEEQLMVWSEYQAKAEHIAEHHDFVKQVLAEIKNFEEDKPFVPFTFARLLKDWILNHIGLTDKSMGNYLLGKAKNGPFQVYFHEGYPED